MIVNVRNSSVVPLTFFLILLYLSSYVLNLYMFMAITGFIMLSFVPGYLILRISLKEKIKIFDISEIIIYSLGLSLSFWAFCEFILNNIILLMNKLFNFKLKIFTNFNIVMLVVLSILVLILFNIKLKIEDKQIFKNQNLNQILFLIILPFFSILGSLLINNYNNNLIALLTIVICPIIMIIFYKYNCRSLAIWVMAISLLLLNTLYSPYLRATDNISEYYHSNLILENGYWEPTIPSGLNSMLCVMMIIPTYSLACSMDLNSVFKFIVPFISSFIPVGLYVAYRRLTNERIAFLSSFFLLSMYEYYTWLGLTMKMTTAGLYLTLLIMLITDDKLDKLTKSYLIVMFGFSLAVSHYGTSYIFMFCIVGAFFINALLNRIDRDRKAAVLLTPRFIAIYLTFAISWYLYNSSSSLFDQMVHIGEHIVRSIVKEYILPKESYMYRVLAGELPVYLQVLKVLYIISTALMVIGLIVYMLIKIKRFKSQVLKENINICNEYLAFSIVCYIAGATVFLGGLSGMCTPDRLYLIISFFLSPFCVIGGITIFEMVKHIFRKFNPIYFILIYLIVFLFFNTCFTAEVIWKYNVGPMISISAPRILKDGNVNELEYLYRVYMFPVDMKAAVWLSEYMQDQPIYCDGNSGKYMTLAKIFKITWEGGTERSNVFVLTNRTILQDDCYVYLSSFNVKTGLIKVGGAVEPIFINVTDVPKLSLCNKIYSNGEVYILYYTG